MYRDSKSTVRLDEEQNNNMQNTDLLLQMHDYQKYSSMQTRVIGQGDVNRTPQRKTSNELVAVYTGQKEKSFSPHRTPLQPRYQAQAPRTKSWVPKKATMDKATQVYDEEVLKHKYNWRKERTNKMVQTDDIIIERLAKEQHEFRKTQAYQRYF